MSSRQLLACKFCGVRRFKSQRGLNQHVTRNAECALLAASELAPNVASDQEDFAQDYVYSPNHARPMGVANLEEVAPQQGAVAAGARARGQLMELEVDSPQERPQIGAVPQANVFFDPGLVLPFPQDEDSYDGDGAASKHGDASDNGSVITCGSYYEPMNQLPLGHTKACLQQFHAYLEHALLHFGPFQKKEILAIKLLDSLRRKRACMDTYEAVLTVFFTHFGLIKENQGLGAAVDYVSRSKMMRKLALRYNMYPQKRVQAELLWKEQGNRKVKDMPLYLEKPMVLPFSGAKVDVIHFDFREQLVSLLTDPRLTDNDFFHFGNDPLARPTEDGWVGDVMTGRAYKATYDDLIKDPEKQMLLPIIFYIDATVTGQVVALKIEALKFTVGIIKRASRVKKHAWRLAGYVPTYMKEISKGKKLFVDSQHDATAFHPLDHEEEGCDSKEVKRDENQKAADWQAILTEILKSYVEFQTKGMHFDYRYGGKTYKNVELVPYVAFVKADTEEADKLCGKYLSRTAKIKNLCRYCECPNFLTASCISTFNLKTESKIAKLIANKKVEELKNISQHCMNYAFHGIRFGSHDNRGIHGATPIDMLHMVLLGIFKYVKNEFFVQVGPTSVAAAKINGLCTFIGKLFARQSDRDLPKTQFGQGIIKGKLMGKEMSGVILLLAAVLQTAAGKKIISKQRGSDLKDEIVYTDWILLLETLLQWEAYMKLEQMQTKHVKRLEKKHRYLFHLLKRVMKRTSGMGMRLVKLHALLHLCLDILNHGVPLNVDTSDNEEHWKPTKVAAKLTQKDMRVFERQTATRLVEFDLLDLAMEEQQGRVVWNYLERENTLPELDADGNEVELPRKLPVVTKGAQIIAQEHPDSGAATWRFANSRAANQKKVEWDQNIVQYLVWLQTDIFERQLEILTEHHRNGQIFRAHPNYRQLGSWNDWVLLDWGNGDKSPAQIWCFLDLTFLGDTYREKVDGVTVQKGVYAVVESTHYEAEEATSEIFRPCIKDAKEYKRDGTIATRQFYLAECEAFLEPVTVIPDIGHANKQRYLQVNARNGWATSFEKWLLDPHHLDDMTDEVEEDRLLKKKYDPDSDDSSEEEAGDEAESDELE